MKIRLSDLWRCDGTVDREPYAALGLGLFLIKYHLDRLIAERLFHRQWSFFDYLSPGGGRSIVHESDNAQTFYATMVAVALPFIWVGVALTLRRLRSLALPPGLVFLFFVPAVNLLWFAVLCVLPSRVPDGSVPPLVPAAPPETAAAEQEPGDDETQRGLSRARALVARLIPESGVGAAAVAQLLTVPLGIAGVLFGVHVLGQYGWGIFVGLPFTMGLMAALIYCFHRQRTLLACIGVAELSVALLGAGLLAFAWEGAVCLIMAAPLVAALAAAGGAIGYSVQCRPNPPADVAACLLTLVLATPALMGAEYAAAPEPPLFAVHTPIEVDAPPDVVWRNVVTFSEIPPPDEVRDAGRWLFRLGIAYPLRAEIKGHGPGAVRDCIFSTGPFVEPIEIWDAPRRLKFSVTRNPAPMQEWTPFARIYPPHLRGFLVSRGGQFLLEPLPGGRTRLVGTTWYHHHMWPARYWQGWSDFIIHCIHLRVLEHVKRLSERRLGQAAVGRSRLGRMENEGMTGRHRTPRRRQPFSMVR